MARETKIVVTDDLTLKPVPDGADTVKVDIIMTMTKLGPDGNPATGETSSEFKAEWEVGLLTANALAALVSNAELADFVRFARPLVTLAGADTEVIRKWLNDNKTRLMGTYPILAKLPERGRLAMEYQAIYRKELASRVNAGDSNGGGRANG